MLTGYTTAHTQSVTKLLHSELGIHIVRLHNLHHTLHKRTCTLHYFLLVGLHTLGHALLIALLVIQDVLDARLQLTRVVRLFQNPADRCQ